MRITEDLIVQDRNVQRRSYTAAQIIAALDGAFLPPSPRTTMPASYGTDSVSPTIHYAAIDTSGNVVTARTTSGVTLTQGLYVYEQPVGALTEFIAIWDEGNPADDRRELIVVDL